MSDEKLRAELATLFRQGAKPPKPKVTLTAEEFEAVLQSLQDLKEQVEADNARLIRILEDKR